MGHLSNPRGNKLIHHVFPIHTLMCVFFNFIVFFLKKMKRKHNTQISSSFHRFERKCTGNIRKLLVHIWFSCKFSLKPIQWHFRGHGCLPLSLGSRNSVRSPSNSTSIDFLRFGLFEGDDLHGMLSSGDWGCKTGNGMYFWSGFYCVSASHAFFYLKILA